MKHFGLEKEKKDKNNESNRSLLIMVFFKQINFVFRKDKHYQDRIFIN